MATSSFSFPFQKTHTLSLTFFHPKFRYLFFFWFFHVSQTDYQFLSKSKLSQKTVSSFPKRVISLGILADGLFYSQATFRFRCRTSRYWDCCWRLGPTSRSRGEVPEVEVKFQKLKQLKHREIPPVFGRMFLVEEKLFLRFLYYWYG